MNHSCILCGNRLPEQPLLTCENMPAQAQNLPTSDTLHKDSKKTLELAQCAYCGLVQFDEEPVYYYRDVIRSGGLSTTMRELRRSQYAHFIDLCGLEGKEIIEVGCGQGEFLSVWSEFPVKAYGIEHNQELVEKARKSGLMVKYGFTEGWKSLEDQYDAFCSFNFLEHQPDPGSMLRSIHEHLREEAYGLITVPSFEYIIEQESYYELIPDHIAYFTKETLSLLLEVNGFAVLESTIVNRDTLSVIVKKRPITDIEGLKRNRTALYDGVKALADGILQKEGKLAVWGASHQGFTLISTARLEGQVSYIIDSAPFKQNHFAPGSHIPIVAPDYYLEHPVDNILVIAPGYTDEIALILRSKLKHTGAVYALRSNRIEEI